MELGGPPAIPLIEIVDATVYRGKTRVFSRLHLTIPQNQNVAVLGPNGAGKTTLLKLINRELYPVQDGGVVRILGQSQWIVSQLRERIGIVSDDLQQHYRKNITALDVVLSGFFSSIGIRRITQRPTQAQRLKAEAAMGRLGIGDYRLTPLGKLSTGQQRRCLLARALVHQPKTLILDEPTAGLDMTGSANFLSTIRDLSSSDHNIVIVTHHVHEIPPEVTRVVLLKDGSVAADGDKQDLLTSSVLSELYDVRLRVIQSGGFFLAHPRVK